MTLFLSVVVAMLFGAAVFVLLGRDVVRTATGFVLLGNAAIVFLLAARLLEGPAPFGPVRDPAGVSDPLVQALALTAIVINFAVSAMAMALVVTLHETEGSIDLAGLTEAQSEAGATQAQADAEPSRAEVEA